MDSFLLATKLRIPPEPRGAVHRPRLTDTLERGASNYKIVLVSAPAGYGKTTLLSQWAHASRLPIAWISLNEEDNNLDRFLRYLLASWQEIQPDVKDSTLGLLLGAALPDSQAVLTAFINVANNVQRHTVFVLNDYHLITDASIHQALTFLLDHLPQTVHFVLVERAEPPLPLARYRARRELLELHASDLQFLQDEAAEFLNRTMELDLSHKEVAGLHAQLEGWIAGLQLVALTLQRRVTRADAIIVTGQHRFIADYLSEDVLAQLSETLRHFMLQTSILESLCASLCDAITGEANGQNSQETLELLERQNLFFMPLDDNRVWFRYHHIFADFLHRELSRGYPDEVAYLHSRAAQWYLAHGLPEQAFRHAVAGEDVDIVTSIANRYVTAKLMSGEIALVKRWLESLPAAWYASHPELGLARVVLLFFTGDYDGCAKCLDEVEQQALAQSDDMRLPLARVTAIRCFIACSKNDLPRAEALAHQAFRELPEGEDFGIRPGLCGSLGDTYRRNGRWEEAREWYMKALSFSRSSVTQVGPVHAYGALADLELRQGRLRAAAAYWRRALDTIEHRDTWGSFPLPVTGWVYIRMAEILYEWNELVEAANYLSKGLERAELGGDVQTLLVGYLIAVRLKLRETDLAAAGEYLERARPLVENAPFLDWVGRFERLQLEFWLAQDRLRAAVVWVDEIAEDDTRKQPLPVKKPGSQESQLAVARILIVKGDVPSLERAAVLLEPLLQEAEAEGRTGVLVEALSLQALARWRHGELTGALTALERALRLAEPEGYVRLFVDLGLPMARLLQEARSREVMPDYIDRLLSAYGSVPTSSATAEGTLPEPLSQREREVLKLIAAGMTNREIAQTLVVSPETVKKHTGSIYSKLGVSNRTEAAAKGRDLDLLN